jgi:hydrogenase maturation protease
MGVHRHYGVVRSGRTRSRADIHTGRPAIPQDPAYVASPDGPSPVRILVAGIGNIFLGDDGFGSEVVRHVPVRQDDSGVRAVDYGIGGMHLAYDLLDEWDALVLVDAVPNRGSPGALHIFEADHESHSVTAALDVHSMDPAAVFDSLKAMGGKPPYTVVVGCEVASVDEGIGLSAAVASAVPRAIDAVKEVVAGLRTRLPAASVEGQG